MRNEREMYVYLNWLEDSTEMRQKERESVEV